ncbi:MAG: hypothetical protein IJS29_05530 [Selenomonadaceae bacterium]|nr:hypothetical protein [Selenomonadaceae bacterium]
MKKLFALGFLALALLLTGCGDQKNETSSNDVNYAALSKQAVQDETGKLVTDFSISKFREIKLDDDIVNTDGVVEIASDGIEHKFRARFNAHTHKCEYIDIDPPYRP